MTRKLNGWRRRTSPSYSPIRLLHCISRCCCCHLLRPFVFPVIHSASPSSIPSFSLTVHLFRHLLHSSSLPLTSVRLHHLFRLLWSVLGPLLSIVVISHTWHIVSKSNICHENSWQLAGSGKKADVRICERCARVIAWVSIRVVIMIRDRLGGGSN